MELSNTLEPRPDTPLAEEVSRHASPEDIEAFLGDFNNRLTSSSTAKSVNYDKSLESDDSNYDRELKIKAAWAKVKDLIQQRKEDYKRLQAKIEELRIEIRKLQRTLEDQEELGGRESMEKYSWDLDKRITVQKIPKTEKEAIKEKIRVLEGQKKDAAQEDVVLYRTTSEEIQRYTELAKSTEEDPANQPRNWCDDEITSAALEDAFETGAETYPGSDISVDTERKNEPTWQKASGGRLISIARRIKRRKRPRVPYAYRQKTKRKGSEEIPETLRLESQDEIKRMLDIFGAKLQFALDMGDIERVKMISKEVQQATHLEVLNTYESGLEKAGELITMTRKEFDKFIRLFKQFLLKNEGTIDGPTSKEILGSEVANTELSINDNDGSEIGKLLVLVQAKYIKKSKRPRVNKPTGWPRSRRRKPVREFNPEKHEKKRKKELNKFGLVVLSSPDHSSIVSKSFHEALSSIKPDPEPKPERPKTPRHPSKPQRRPY